MFDFDLHMISIVVPSRIMQLELDITIAIVEVVAVTAIVRIVVSSPLSRSRSNHACSLRLRACTHAYLPVYKFLVYVSVSAPIHPRSALLLFPLLSLSLSSC